MKTTMRSVITTLTASLLAVTTWLTPAAAMPNLNNLLNSGGGGVLKLPDVMYPSDYALQRALNTSTGLSDVVVRWRDTSPADAATLIERANSAGAWSTLVTLGPLDGPQATLRDITRIGVYTGSTDAFCVSQIQLIVNTAVAFDRTWGDSAATCEWVDGYNANYISHDELRASPQFVNFQSPIMSPLVETDELESRLQAVVDTLIFERLDVDWRNPGVTVSRLTDNTIRANVYLENTDFGGPNIDLRLDVQVSFIQSGGNWELSFEPANFHASVDFPWWEDVLVAIIDPVCVPATAIAGAAFEDCMSQLEKYIAKEIKKGFDIPSKRIAVVLPDKCVTPQVTVLSDAALFFSCAQARTTTTKGTTVLKGLVPAARLTR
jgi:hypothetical protein